MYHFEWIIMHNHEHELKYDILARHIFSQNDLDTQANLCKNILYPETIKNNNGAILTKITCVRRK